MVGEEFWLRFFRLKVYNNQVRDTLFLYFYRQKKVPRTIVLNGDTVLIRLSGTPHGGLEDAMPDEIQMPLDNIRTKKGHPIDHSSFESMIIVRPGIKLSDGSIIPTVVHAFCQFEGVQLSNLAFNKTVQSAVNNVKETQKLLESGPQATSLKGKNYIDTERVVKDSFGLLGKDRKDEISFEEFKLVLSSLEIKFTEARAYKWFVLGDINRNGLIDVGEATFILYVVAASKPSRLLRPRDVFLMFDTDSKPRDQLDSTGTIDLIGFYECVRAFNSQSTQEEIERVFRQVDQKHLHRLNYQQFLNGWVQLVQLDSELEKRGMSTKQALERHTDDTSLVQDDARVSRTLQQALFEILQVEDKEEDEDLRLAVKRAHHARGKVRAGREQGKRERIKSKAETDKQARRQKALEERAKRLAAIQAEAEAAKRAQLESRLHHDAMIDKRDRERKELEQIRLAALEADEHDAKKRRELALDRINMSQKGLSYIPATLWVDPESKKHLPYIITMDVSQNQLVSLPEKHLFQATVQLRKLDCSNNKLRSLPKAINSCHELLLLRADDNQLSSLPDLTGLGELQVLSARGNKMRQIAEQTSSLRELRKLNLSLNPITDLHAATFASMIKLSELNLEGCDLEFLPETVFENNKLLRTLHLTGNKLRELPSSIGSLTSLETLNANHNSLRLLPDTVGQLHKLMRLNLGHNQLRELPKKLDGLYYLLELQLEQNVLTELPQSIGQLTSIQVLNVKHNKLRELPDVLGRLEDVQLLDCSHNNIIFLPETVGGMLRMKHLDASHNSLGQGGVVCFPQSFASLQSLEWADFSYNCIQHIAPQIAGLSSLGAVNFSKNALKVLPAELFSIPTLRILDISFNHLESIPIELGLLTKLEALDCPAIDSNPCQIVLGI
jgi:Leucine-rich repeat (LRR) protein/Ca2+-binding EF-hand superfamily protein